MVSHRDHLFLVLYDQHFVEIPVATDRTGRFPSEPRGDHLARFHLAAVAELRPQPLVGWREAGVVG
jgi:hypothetical protein